MRASCTPVPLDPDGFNPRASLPYGLTTEHIAKAMTVFIDFLGFVNGQLATKGIARLERADANNQHVREF